MNATVEKSTPDYPPAGQFFRRLEEGQEPHMTPVAVRENRSSCCVQPGTQGCCEHAAPGPGYSMTCSSLKMSARPRAAMLEGVGVLHCW